MAPSDLSSPHPRPAQPILASALLESALRQRSDGNGRVKKIRSGVDELDEYVLLGGVERGVVMGLSAGLGVGGVDVGRMVSW